MRRPLIVVCNDDGIHGPGLFPLAAAMRRLGRVLVCVPEHERSADSHSLTLHKPIRVLRVREGVYTLNGSPADCARLALLELSGGRADLLVSGINRGYNLGEDVVYSGTVAAAMEATLLGTPAAAFSQDQASEDYRAAAESARRLAARLLRRVLPAGVCLNVNFPVPGKGPFPAPAAARLGRRDYGKALTRRRDPRGKEYYWLAGRTVRGVDEPGTDVAAVARGRPSMTPLSLDRTDYAALKEISAWSFPSR